MSVVINWFKTTDGQAWAGLASVAGLLLSLYLWYATGRIRKSLKSYSAYIGYKSDKKNIAKQLSSLAPSMMDDGILDNKIKAEAMELLSQIEGYREFMAPKAMVNLWWAQWILSKRDLTPKSASRVAAILAYLAGKLKAKGEFIP